MSDTPISLNANDESQNDALDAARAAGAAEADQPAVELNDEFDEPPIPSADVPPAPVPDEPAQPEPLMYEEAVERTNDLLKRMNGQRPTLLAVLDLCSEPRTAAEVEACVEQRHALNHSVFSSARLCDLLQQAGALEQVDEQGAPFVEKEPEPRVVVVDGVECLEPAEPAEPLWHTTAAGADVEAAEDPAVRLQELLDDPDELIYLPIYERVLTMCADEDGATTRALGEAVDHDPLVQKPRLFVMHFVERLEERSAVVWDGAAWKTTDLGIQALEGLVEGFVPAYEPPAANEVPVSAAAAAAEPAPEPEAADEPAPAAAPVAAAAATAAEGVSDEFADLARANDLRADQYAAVARLFRVEVDQPLLDELRAACFPVNSGNKKIDAGNRAIACYLSETHTDVLTDLAVDYVHTFVGAGINGHEAAYPFESVYTSEKRLLMQGARDEVRALYRAYDLDKQDSWREGEDHVALELEFVGTLARRAADALRAGDEDAAASLLAAQRNFLNDHLAVWAPKLAADMRHFARTEFYRGLADLFEGTLEVDRAFLDDVLGTEDEQA